MKQYGERLFRGMSADALERVAKRAARRARADAVKRVFYDSNACPDCEQLKMIADEAYNGVYRDYHDLFEPKI